MTKREPWHPADYTLPDIDAIQAIAAGIANADQQKRALGWIVNQAAATYDQSFVPGQQDVGAFLEGRRSVGNQIVKLMKLNKAEFQKAARDGRKPSKPKEPQ